MCFVGEEFVFVGWFGVVLRIWKAQSTLTDVGDVAGGVLEIGDALSVNSSPCPLAAVLRR